MKTAACGSERSGTPTPHDEAENNLMWRATHGSQDIVGAGQTAPRIPAEARLFPRRRGAPLGNCRALKHGACSDQSRARRAEVDTLITRAENPNVRANMTASVRRALRAPTMARCMPRALETRRDGRMADGERQISRDPLSPFAIRISPFATTRFLPSARGWRPRPWRRHTLVWSPLGGVSTQAGVNA
jgi:hypothetical protein